MRRINYIHQLERWPNFVFDLPKLTNALGRIQFLQGRLHGQMEQLTPELRKQAIINALSAETQASCDIEAAHFDQLEIESAVARSLKIRIPDMVPSGGMAKGAAEMVVQAAAKHDKKLSSEQLCQWHTLLYPSEKGITIGAWRNHPLDIKDPKTGNIRFAAPNSDLLMGEMKRFIQWINQDFETHPLIKSGIAHLWFLTLHPFEDGNGQLSRAISLSLIAASEAGLPRYHAPSVILLKEKETYFQMLENTQSGNLDITEWLQWYMAIIEKSITDLKLVQAEVITKQKLEEKMEFKGLTINQKQVLRTLSQQETPYFTSADWAAVAGYSKDTALREIRTLLNLRLIQKLSHGGRSTRYRIAN